MPEEKEEVTIPEEKAGETLKACPFCGNQSEPNLRDGGVYCPTCGASAVTIEAWTCRTPSAESGETVKNLVDCCEKYQDQIASLQAALAEKENELEEWKTAAREEAHAADEARAALAEKEKKITYLENCKKTAYNFNTELGNRIDELAADRRIFLARSEKAEAKLKSAEAALAESRQSVMTSVGVVDGLNTKLEKLKQQLSDAQLTIKRMRLENQ